MTYAEYIKSDRYQAMKRAYLEAISKGGRRG